nr:NAD(P)-binding domain-containing protein [Bacteroidales bacterium]
MKTIGFIGGGRITRIFLRAFEKNNNIFEKVAVFDTNSDVLNTLKARFPHISITGERIEYVAQSDIIFLAVHPPVMMETLEKIKDTIQPNAVVVSLAPKITTEKISAALSGFKNIIRMNPSASTVICKGINPIAFYPEIAAEVKATVLKFFAPYGYTPEVEESKIEAYAVISAMGHTYYFFQLQKLKELAINFGMNEKEAETVISEMVTSSAETLFSSGLSYNEVADLVPVRPLAEVEKTIEGFYDQHLTAIFNKIKPV